MRLAFPPRKWTMAVSPRFIMCASNSAIIKAGTFCTTIYIGLGCSKDKHDTVVDPVLLVLSNTLGDPHQVPYLLLA
jgi:hypothetical protein